WELSRKSNSRAFPSSGHYSKVGKEQTGRLKIVLINSSDKGGGAEKIAFNMHQKLIALGHDSTLLVQKKKSNISTVIEISDNWKEELTAINPDIIHIHNLHGTSISLEQLSIISENTSIIFTLHDSWLTTGSTEHPFELNPSLLSFLNLKEWLKELEKRKNALTGSRIQFTVPSQWLRERFFSAHGIRPFFVPNGIDEIEPTEPSIPSERFILFVANRPVTNPYKDFATLKKGWKLANEKLGSDGCDLICLGGEPSSETIGGHSLQILSPKDAGKVRSYMEASILVVQASKQDNAPITILEAHHVGKFVLGSLAGGIPELLTPIEKEWAYEPENPKQFAGQLIKAI
ncbi:MAG: glycosyltransferase, partial [Flavobacteriales bacterium]|nr:glycosyltransferase [Flavobacteriales bacterium]